ncbi:MAG: hypothetical protein LC650_04520 [Actinobacteria bacterium]|nr:hypothetical protein [Actinomycetota bacterium]
MGLYWNNDGLYEEAAKALMTLIPGQGAVNEPRKNKALEKFRKASNCYYDLYNNGLGNRMSEFRKVFGFAASPYRQRWKGYGCFDAPLYTRTEDAMHEIIRNAAHEQGVYEMADVATEPGVTNTEKALLAA